ncbi:MAG: hypothetical protein ACOCP2_04275 [Halohasta sp.]
MKYDDTDSQPSVSRRSVANRALKFVSKILSYALVVVSLGAFYSFFAPHLGTPTIGIYSALPEITARTESEAVVNAAPLILGVVSAAVAVYLR